MNKKTKKIAKETARKLETDVGCAGRGLAKSRSARCDVEGWRFALCVGGCGHALHHAFGALPHFHWELVAVVDDLDADPSFVDEVVKHLGYDEQNRIEEREESRRPDVHKRHWMTDASH